LTAGAAYSCQIPEWWGSLGVTPNGADIKFYEDKDFSGYISTIKQLADPDNPQCGEILLPGTHEKTFTFNNCNNDSEHVFNWYLCVPDTSLEVD
jgi:hypothetical protein